MGSKIEPKTLAEKIMSRASKSDAHAGEFVEAEVAKGMMNDITGPLAVKGFYEIADKVAHPERIVIIYDHQSPADSLDAAKNHIILREFSKEQKVLNYDVKEGVCHQIMPEKGHVKPGDLIVGSDSHTCAYGSLGAFSTGIGSTDMAAVLATGKLWFKVPETIRIELKGKLPRGVYSKDVILHIIGDLGADGATYKAVEFYGETVKEISVSERMTMCNMAIEMGGKAGMIEADEITEEYMKERLKNFKLDPYWKTDENADYKKLEYDISDLSPQIACPHRVDNVKPIEDVEGIELDQIFIGSCTNGRVEDLKVVSEIIGDNKIDDGVRVIIIPASRTEYLKALNAGLIKRFVEAGAIVEFPSCGPCFGGSFGLLGDGEVGLSTSNRNFRGRQGSADAEIYLSSPAVAAASALKGVITDPRKI
jgi:3-isopropylmalate dehydratase, large subunit (EC 4.2.1.33)